MHMDANTTQLVVGLIQAAAVIVAAVIAAKWTR